MHNVLGKNTFRFHSIWMFILSKLGGNFHSPFRDFVLSSSSSCSVQVYLVFRSGGKPSEDAMGLGIKSSGVKFICRSQARALGNPSTATSSTAQLGANIGMWFESILLFETDTYIYHHRKWSCRSSMTFYFSCEYQITFMSIFFSRTKLRLIWNLYKLNKLFHFDCFPQLCRRALNRTRSARWNSRFI